MPGEGFEPHAGFPAADFRSPSYGITRVEAALELSVPTVGAMNVTQPTRSCWAIQHGRVDTSARAGGDWRSRG